MVNSPRSTFSEQSGLSLIELLVVMVIITIIGTIALMQRGSANEQLKRQNAATQLKNAFERARFDSVKRRPDLTAAQAKVDISVNGYTLTTDLDLNGVLTSSDDRVTDLIPQRIQIKDYNGGFLPKTVYYNKRGEAVDINGSPISPIFYVCNITCNSPNPDNSNILLVTPTGTVNLLPGGTQLPTFGVPAISSVPTNTGVNPDSVTP